ncbi:Uncharacterised protein [Segatella copri]|nr:Uncharacterised protein [Segatella copri]
MVCLVCRDIILLQHYLADSLIEVFQYIGTSGNQFVCRGFP